MTDTSKKARQRKVRSPFSDELLDQLLAQVSGKDAESLLGESGLIGQLKKQLAQRMLSAELNHHLSSEAATEGPGNHRNGSSTKTVITPNGALDLNIPRDRLSTFEPQLVAKYQRRLPGFNDHVISMYGRGMTIREESRPRLFGQQIGLDKWSLAVIMPRVFPAAGCCSKSHLACGRQATDAVAEYCRN